MRSRVVARCTSPGAPRRRSRAARSARVWAANGTGPELLVDRDARTRSDARHRILVPAWRPASPGSGRRRRRFPPCDPRRGLPRRGGAAGTARRLPTSRRAPRTPRLTSAVPSSHSQSGYRARNSSTARSSKTARASSIRPASASRHESAPRCNGYHGNSSAEARTLASSSVPRACSRRSSQRCIRAADTSSWIGVVGMTGIHLVARQLLGQGVALPPAAQGRCGPPRSTTTAPAGAARWPAAGPSPCGRALRSSARGP